MKLKIVKDYKDPEDRNIEIVERIELKKHADSHAIIDGDDPITPSSIGAISFNDIKTIIVEVNNDSEWTESEGYYYLDVTDLTDILESDNPIVDIIADNNNDYIVYEKNFSNIFRI